MNLHNRCAHASIGTYVINAAYNYYVWFFIVTKLLFMAEIVPYNFWVSSWLLLALQVKVNV